MTKGDPVDAPWHYLGTGMECIDAIREALGYEAFTAYCRGQVLKYVWRAPHKGNQLQDLRKAGWYLQRAIAELDAQNAGG